MAKKSAATSIGDPGPFQGPSSYPLIFPGLTLLVVADFFSRGSFESFSLLQPLLITFQPAYLLLIEFN